MSDESTASAKRRLAELYSRVAPDYVDRGPPLFAYAGRRLVELARVGPGDAVLDLCSGRGAVLLPAAECVGPTGQAIGIDLAAGMVEHTAADLRQRSVSWASVRQMDADHLEFPDRSFTHVLCSFAVFFFPDLHAVLKEVQRVLRRNGIVGFAFERQSDPRWSWYEDYLRARGAFQALPPMPGNPTIRKHDALVTELRAAGFVDAQEVVEEAELFFADADAWWESLWTHGSRSVLDVLQREALSEFKRMSLERVHSIATPNGVPEQHQFVFVLAAR